MTIRKLPPSLWASDILHLPTNLTTAHRERLVSKGWLSEYAPKSATGTVGGSTAAEARLHFINRFLNSAARAQYIGADPRLDRGDIHDAVMEQFADGHISVLDIAAGHGAGMLAILSMICEFRAENFVPRLPLNVHITAIDYSPDALILYQEILEDLQPWLQEQGIQALLNPWISDLRIMADCNAVLDAFFDDAKALGIRRFFCLISAVSGLGKEGLEAIHDSLKIAAARLQNKGPASTLLWIEPLEPKTWITIFAHTIKLILLKASYVFRRSGDSYTVDSAIPVVTDRRSIFEWFDPHLNANARSVVVVMAFNKG
jgi:hypothetical protein